jgi:hypothetical protein
MARPFGVLESTDRRHRTTRFSFLGVPVSTTRFSPLALPLVFLSALPYAFWRDGERLSTGLAKGSAKYGALMALTTYLHSIGHILSGKAVGAPMDELIVTGTRHVNHYVGAQEQYPRSTHIARALGGPFLNVIVALLALAIFRRLGNRPQWATDFALFNAVWGLGSFMPIASLDGASILEQLRNR